MASQTAPQGYDGDVTVYIRDLNSREAIPHRIIYLQPPTFEKKIGRGSQAEHHLNPQPWNTWFGSRVMSREHATLRADPVSKTLTVEDTQSMHGTYVKGKRIAPGQKIPLERQDRIQFGTEIVRGDQTYKPLEVLLAVDFDGDDLPSRPASAPAHGPKNTFRIDFSDEENEDDEDIEVIYESIRVQSCEPEKPSKTFSVPDSETSDSYLDQAEQEYSAPSSPVEVSNANHSKAVPWSKSSNSADKMGQSVTTHMSRIPGSSAHDALDVDADDEQISKETDAGSTHSDEDDNSVNEDPLNEDEDEDDDDTHPSDFEREWTDGLEEDDWNEEMEAEREMAKTQDYQPGNHLFHRQPSPSDCALPKPSWYSQNPQSGNLPKIHNLVEQASAQSGFAPQTFSVPQPPLMSQYQPFYCGSMNWTQADNNPPFHAPYDTGFGVPQLPNMSLTVPSTTYNCTLSTPLAALDAGEPEIVSVSREDEAHSKSSKVSINAIIEDIQAVNTASNNKHKRKADEISNDSIPEESATISKKQQNPSQTANTQIDVTCVPKHADETITSIGDAPQLQSELDLPVEKPSPSKKSVTFSSEPEIIEPDLDRPKKWAKRQHQPEAQGSNFFKYFATAVAGATVGAVGTVFGLAALPADYFV